jgi:hypothetical protein
MAESGTSRRIDSGKGGSKRSSKRLHHLVLPRGVTLWGDRFRAQAVVRGCYQWLGLFETVAQAEAAYRAAKGGA